MMGYPTWKVRALAALLFSLAALLPLGAASQEAPPAEGDVGESDSCMAAMEARLVALQAQVDELSAEVARLRAERDRFSRAIARLSQWGGALEADRLLLADLRKELPDTRREAEAYLRRLQRLALQSDPVRLGPLVNRVMQAAPVYLDWRDQEFASREEAAREFERSGAHGFTAAFANFRNAILLTVSNRLDALLSLLE